MILNDKIHQHDTMYSFFDLSEDFTEAEKESIKKMCDNDEDSRNISDDLMNAFMNGTFKAFREFAITHDDLSICFRGNDNPKSIIIYHFNHVVWELYITERPKKYYKVRINFDHARYMEDWKHYMLCFEELKFSPKIPKKNKSSVTIGELICDHGEYDMENFVAKTYDWIVGKMMKSYFNPNENTDWFRKSLSSEQTDRQTRSKNPCIEKRWQQSLFKEFQKSGNTGLFLYDLEFSQKFPSKDIREKLSPIINEPDMLGIRYVAGQAASLVLIEVKSTWAACSGTSGINTHLEKMKEYSHCKELMDNRKKEALELLKRYRKLGILNDNLEIPETLPANFPIERLLILTNSIIPETNKPNDKKDAIAYFKKNEKELTEIAQACQCDIWLIKGNYNEEFEIEREILSK